MTLPCKETQQDGGCCQSCCVSLPIQLLLLFQQGANCICRHCTVGALLHTCLKDAQSALSVAVVGNEELAALSQEYMRRLDKYIEFLEVDKYADWHDDKRIVLEFENRELSFRGLIMQLATKCSVDVTFPENWL